MTISISLVALEDYSRGGLFVGGVGPTDDPHSGGLFFEGLSGGSYPHEGGVYVPSGINFAEQIHTGGLYMGTPDEAFGPWNPLHIGTAAKPMYGFMDEFRVVPYCKYRLGVTFTPPVPPFNKRGDMSEPSYGAGPPPPTITPF